MNWNSETERKPDMQRIINNPDYVVEDMLKGFGKNHRSIVEPTHNPRVLKSRFANVLAR